MNAPAQRAARVALQVYVAAFAALAIYEIAALTPREWLARCVAAAALTLALAGAWRPARFRAALDLGILGVLASVVAPLAAEFAGGAATLADVVAQRLDWAAAPLMLLGWLALSLGREIAATAYFADPRAAAPAAAPLSLPAALALGGLLTALFYETVGVYAGRGAGPVARMTLSALRGSTVIHGAIVLLFFVILAAVAEGGRALLADAAAIRSLARQGAPPSAEAARVSRGCRLVAAALASDEADAGRARAAYEEAGRRFLRALPPLLPLIGFLGTVIGIGAAVAELPAALGADTSSALSGSLAGLAIKFETTLLGLLGNMIAATAIALLEKSEAELAGAAQRAAESIARTAP